MGKGRRVDVARRLRFWNRDVILNTEGVGDAILRAMGGAAQDAG